MPGLAQPNGKLQISLTIPEGFDKDKLLLSVLKKMEHVKMEGYVDGDEYVFLIDHFSIYVLAEVEEVTASRGA